MSNRILIIDDESHIRRMMRLTLEAAGYEVVEARDGEEGLSAYDGGSNWSAVVLDQRMPGMDGLETLRQLKKRDPAASVVMATAYASIELAVDAMKAGATDFVRKPLTPDMLRNAVRAAIAKRTSKETEPVTRAHDEVARPLIETITMNGFKILDPENGEWRLPDQRRFVVISPTGSRSEVVVRIDEEVLSYVQRLTGRVFPVESSFWSSQARRLLSDFLWEKGEVPPMGVLTLDEIGRNELAAAEVWVGP
jgi:FixJ family two-component response regulator